MITSNDIEEIRVYLESGVFRFAPNYDDGQDLIQDTILKLLEKKDTLRKDSLNALAYRIMKNIYIDQYRKKVSSNTLVMLDSTELPIPTSITSDGFILCEDIKNKISQLSTRYRKPLMARIEGYTFTEIAEMCEISPVTTRVYVAGARIKLKEKLKAA